MDQDRVRRHLWLFDTAVSLGSWVPALRTLVAAATISLDEAAGRLPELVDDVCSLQERVTVTVAGRPAVMLLAVDDLAALEESLAVLSYAGTMRQLTESDEPIARGEGESEQQLAAAMRDAAVARDPEPDLLGPAAAVAAHRNSAKPR